MKPSAWCVWAALLLLVHYLPAQSISKPYFAAEIANDVFYLPLKTDRYFTSGIQLEAGRSNLQPNLLIPALNTHHTRYWRINQSIFTPQAIDSVRLVRGDHPFASYLVLSNGVSVVQPLLGTTVTSEWTLGVLGKYSGGGRMQNALHRMVNFAEEIPGWNHEVKPDLIVNYRLHYQRLFFLSPRLHFEARLAGQLGSLYTDGSMGMALRAVPLQFNSRTFVELILGSTTRVVGYNATLSGGLFNRDDRYRGVIVPKRIVGRTEYGGAVHLNGLVLEGGVVMLGKEFDGGLSHRWAWIGLRLE
ncbi:DUF2219 family protein [Neolewinella lacunae]|uniref:Lipid A deacylase LpxR family protein n=1 Tax=Neolewinella lacunae TaxID=1517758 RepID=A0A923PLJ0_9BACT|nr:lipid A-modifier LpxR family protein [Neolewinella lacunae]MBC6996383.1 lipid A deacylase LpxR family protein [Neolewinella lacunae]MDN3633674.1 DUF2219 family protein [Neolewinella lacunae]